LSSTTRRSPERGQVLVLFAGGIIGLLIIAALAFDVGMMLVERRDQQNAADAAALAGARFLITDDAAAEAAAEAAARQLAIDNGFDDADASEIVNVYIPPIHGKYKGFPRFIEVQIEATRPSVFGGVIGRAAWPVGSFAVATNAQNLTFPFSMMALDPTACKAIHVSGDGLVEAYANIQSNSTGADCAPGDPVSFSRTGGSTIDVIADDATCRAVGEIQDQGSGSMTCTPAENSFALPDPLRNLPAPAKPALPTTPMVPVGHTTAPPADCPGATPASKAPSETSPNTCKLAPNGGYKDLEWILYPGLYPGGLEVDAGTTAYLMPGIYWIGGGGLQVKGGGSIFSIATETDATANIADATYGDSARCLEVSTTPDPDLPYKCGVLIYNSKLPSMAGGEVHLNGTGATMKLEAFETFAGDPNDIYNDIVIFQDRTVTTPVTLNGSSSSTEVEGVIYVPEGQVKLNGNGGTLIVDQIIAGTYDINGNGGTIKVEANLGFDSVITAAGLVE
jgi:hypothetical protein